MNRLPGVLVVGLFVSVSFATVIPAQKDHVVSLDGMWRFKLEQAKGKYDQRGETGILPIDYPQKIEPFYQSDYREDAKWHDLKVPGNWEMYGFSPATYNQPDNASGLYRLWIEVPKNWEGRLVKLNFDGVQNGAEFWLNGQPVKVDEPSWGRENYHEGGWTAFQVDLTPQVKFGAKNLLAVRVTKNTKSVNMDTGDYFFLGGIHRPVTLFSVPQSHLADIKVETRLLSGKAEVKVIATIASPRKGMKLSASLADVGSSEAEVAEGQDRIVLTQIVEKPKLWSAEFPDLYSLTVNLLDGQDVAETWTRRIGIREMSIKDGVLLINGVPIKLAGMCRHDVSAEDGTAVGPALWRKDIELMKSANINAIRTSHYPYGSGFYDLCDELGMYVIDELPYCWTPTDEPEMAPAFLQRARETLRRDQNHPSVIVWTIGNENKEGRNLQSVADLVKQLDSTRPRAVSCFGGAKYNVELSDSHYTTPDKIEQSAQRAKQVGRPHIYLENPNDWDVRLAADPSCWDAWAPVLQRCWDVEAREETLPGTFLWEWQDRAIADKNDTRLYFFDPRSGINYFKIKGQVDAFRNPRPWLYHVKMIYSPIQVGAKLSLSDSGEATFNVENRYSFTDVSQLRTKWRLLGEGKTTASGEITAEVGPRSKGGITIKLPPEGRQASALRVDFDDASGRNVVSHQFTIKPERVEPMSTKLPDGLRFPQFNLITRDTGKDPGFWRKVTRFKAKLDHAIDQPLKQGDKVSAQIVMENEPEKVVGRVEAEYTDNQFKYRINWTGPKADVQEVGWMFSMPKPFDHFSWDRDALWTVYPETHIGRPRGVARPDSADVPLTKITRPDAFDFVSTKNNCNWAALSDESGSGLRVEFAKDQQHHCRGGIAAAGYQLFVNRHVCPPRDLSTPGVLDLYLTLNPGDTIDGSFRIGSSKR